MAITKQVKIDDIYFDTYSAFINAVTITNDNDTIETEIYKDDAIKLIHLFIKHFDLTLSDIILK